MDSSRRRLLAVISNQYVIVCYTHKAHEKERERASRRVRFEKWIRIILACAAASTITVEALSSRNPGAIVSTVFGSLALLYHFIDYRLRLRGEFTLIP